MAGVAGHSGPAAAVVQAVAIPAAQGAIEIDRVPVEGWVGVDPVGRMTAWTVVALVAARGVLGSHEVLTVTALAKLGAVAAHQGPVEVDALLLHPLLRVDGVESAGGILAIGTGHRDHGNEKEDEQQS